MPQYTRAEIERRVIEITKEYADADRYQIPVTLHSDWSDDLEFDSLDSLELLLDVEDEFGVDVPDAEAATWSTVGAMVGGLCKILGVPEPQTVEADG